MLYACWWQLLCMGLHYKCDTDSRIVYEKPGVSLLCQKLLPASFLWNFHNQHGWQQIWRKWSWKYSRPIKLHNDGACRFLVQSRAVFFSVQKTGTRKNLHTKTWYIFMKHLVQDSWVCLVPIILLSSAHSLVGLDVNRYRRKFLQFVFY